MGQNDTFVIIDLLLSPLPYMSFSPPLFFFLIKIIISFFTWYQSPNLGFLMAALNLPVVARVWSLHYFSGPLRAIDLNQLYLSHLRFD